MSALDDLWKKKDKTDLDFAVLHYSEIIEGDAESAAAELADAREIIALAKKMIGKGPNGMRVFAMEDIKAFENAIARKPIDPLVGTVP